MTTGSMPYINWLKYLTDRYTRENITYEELKQMNEDNKVQWGNAYKKLEALREIVLKNINYDIKSNINSSFRSEKRNEEIGGVKNSLHTTGFAIDIQLDSQKKLVELLIGGNKEIEALQFYYIFYTKEEASKPLDIKKLENWVHIQAIKFTSTSERYVLKKIK